MAFTDVNTYLNEIGRFPVLTPEAQLRHCQAIKRWCSYEGGKDAAPLKIKRSGKRSLDVMLQTNIRLVVSLAKKYQDRGVDFSDLIQEGTLGLMRGLELFDPSRGYAVSTYAYWWIRQALTRAIHTHGRLIRLPTNMHELFSRVQRFSSDYSSYHGHEPSISEIASALEIEEYKILQMLDTYASTLCSSLDIPTRTDSPTAIIELIGDTNGTSPTEFAVKEIFVEDLDAAMAFLTDSERVVIEGIYFRSCLVKELAAELKISRSRVGQLHKRAVYKLRRLLSSTHADN